MAIPEAVAPPPARPDSMRTRLAGPMLLFAALLVVCYLPMLKMTATLLVNSDDMAHGFFAPIVAGYVAYLSIGRPPQLRLAPSPWGIVSLLIAACLAIIATLGNSTTMSRFAFLVSAAGCLLLIGGGSALRRFQFPLLLLVFTFPVPGVLYGDITQPLQLLASRLSESAFELLGYGVVRDGNILQLAHMNLSVVEACSGLRSLVTLAFFCVVYGYFFESRTWVRISLVLLAVPAAIFVNVLRITGTGILGRLDPALTTGLPHEFLGWAGFFIGFGLVFLCHRLLVRSFDKSAKAVPS